MFYLAYLIIGAYFSYWLVSLFSKHQNNPFLSDQDRNDINTLLNFLNTKPYNVISFVVVTIFWLPFLVFVFTLNNKGEK